MYSVYQKEVDLHETSWLNIGCVLVWYGISMYPGQINIVSDEVVDSLPTLQIIFKQNVCHLTRLYIVY